LESFFGDEGNDAEAFLDLEAVVGVVGDSIIGTWVRRVTNASFFRKNGRSMSLPKIRLAMYYMEFSIDLFLKKKF